MCIMLPPFWGPLWRYRETLAMLTPFWVARRQMDEIIERDRKLSRKRRHGSDTSSGSGETDQESGFTVEFNKGFYYIWFDRFSTVYPGSATCMPLMICYPDYIVQKCKLRRDQIEYIEQKKRIRR